jgi:hypothetical protein
MSQPSSISCYWRSPDSSEAESGKNFANFALIDGTIDRLTIHLRARLELSEGLENFDCEFGSFSDSKILIETRRIRSKYTLVSQRGKIGGILARAVVSSRFRHDSLRELIALPSMV